MMMVEVQPPDDAHVWCTREELAQLATQVQEARDLIRLELHACHGELMQRFDDLFLLRLPPPPLPPPSSYASSAANALPPPSYSAASAAAAAAARSG